MKITTATNILNHLVAQENKKTEKLLLPVLYKKASEAAKLYPEDLTCRDMLGFLHKKAKKNETFISVADLNTAYQTFYHANNRFRDVFASELQEKENKKEEKKFPKLFDSFASEDKLQKAKQDLSNELVENYFSAKLSQNKIAPIKFTKQAAKEAEDVCRLELNLAGYAPQKLSVAEGNENFILCSAGYETPKGLVNFILPVEMKGNQAFRPNLFLSASGPQDLNAQNLEREIHISAGKTLTLQASQLLQALEKMKFGSEDDSVSRALAKKSLAEASYFDQNGIILQIPDKKARQDVQLPKIPIPNEIAKVAERLTSQAGRAELKFGRTNIERAKSSILNKLASCGYQQADINVLASDEQNVIYAVRFSPRQAIRVPVKISKEKFILPETIIANGSVYDFSSQGISSALENTEIDSRALSATSPVHEMTPNELLNEVKKASQTNNLKLAEEAVLALHKTANHALYHEGYRIYSKMLSGGLQKEASQKSSCCSRQIKVANSQHMTCAHTNLPITKVYQDSFGRCHPLYRQNMKEDYSGATFMNYQVFWGKEI